MRSLKGACAVSVPASAGSNNLVGPDSIYLQACRTLITMAESSARWQAVAGPRSSTASNACPWAGDHPLEREVAATTHVLDALAMSPIAASNVALNSLSLCCTESPSVSAREKLAMTPRLRDSFSHASSRL